MKTRLPTLRRRLIGHREDGTRVYSRMKLRDCLVALIAGQRSYIMNVHVVGGIKLAQGSKDVFVYGIVISPDDGIPPKGITGVER